MRHRAVVAAAFATARLAVEGNSTHRRASVNDAWEDWQGCEHGNVGLNLYHVIVAYIVAVAGVDRVHGSYRFVC